MRGEGKKLVKWFFFLFYSARARRSGNSFQSWPSTAWESSFDGISIKFRSEWKAKRLLKSILVLAELTLRSFFAELREMALCVRWNSY